MPLPYTQSLSITFIYTPYIRSKNAEKAPPASNSRGCGRGYQSQGLTEAQSSRRAASLALLANHLKLTRLRHRANRNAVKVHVVRNVQRKGHGLRYILGG